MKEQAHQHVGRLRTGGACCAPRRDLERERREEILIAVISTEWRQREAGVRFDHDPGDEDRS